MKLANKILALMLVLMLMVCVVPAVFAASGPDQEPIAWDGTSDLNVTIQPGETKYYAAPAGGKQITFNVAAEGQVVSILDKNGEMVTGASYRWGAPVPGLYAFPDDAAGSTVVFALSVDANGAAAEVTATISDIVYGGVDMPLNLNKQGPGAYHHFFKATITDDWDPVYYCVYEAEANGVIVIESTPKGETGDYFIEVTDENYNVVAGDAWTPAGNMIISWAVQAGKIYNIVVIGTAVGDEISCELINYETAFDAIAIKDTAVTLPVNAGASIEITDGSVNPKWHGKGVTITCDTEHAIGKTEVIYNGDTYTDVDQDGKICLTLEDYSNATTIIRNRLTIVNHAGKDVTYSIVMGDEPVEEGNCPHNNKYEVEAFEPGCHQNGSKGYWHCPDCNMVCKDEAMTQLTNVKDQAISYDRSNIEKVDGWEVSCHQNGVATHWHCTKCDMVFADEALTTVTSIKELSTPYDRNNIVYVEPVEVSCHQDGTNGYYRCVECNAVFKDEGLTVITSVPRETIPYDTNNIEHYEAVEPGCHETGMKEYWFCTDCKCFFADASLTTVTNAKLLVIDRTAEIIHYKEKAPCHENGWKEHWECAGCNSVFEDAELTVRSNKKYVTLLADRELTYVEGYEAGCHQNGLTEHWYCAECDTYFADAEGKQNVASLSLVIPHTAEVIHYEYTDPCHVDGWKEHWECSECHAVFENEQLTALSNKKNVTLEANRELDHHEAVEAGCHQDGMMEHWYCPACDTYFADAEGKQNVASLSLVIPHTAEVVYTEGKPACHTDGWDEYWQCSDCETIFANEELTVVTNIKNLTQEADCELIHVEGYEAGCHQNGLKEHWYCDECEMVYLDAEGTNVTNMQSVKIPYTAEVIHYEEKAACHEDGWKEHWVCTECDAVFTNAELTALSNKKNVTLEADRELTHVEGYEAGCHQNGLIEHWYCDVCECYYTDAEGKFNVASLSLVIPYDVDNVIYVEPAEAGCHQNGTNGYYHCVKCDMVFKDATLTIVTNVKNESIPFNRDNIKHVPATEATAEKDGNHEYWICEECHMVFTDAALTQVSNIKNVTIPATGGPAATGDIFSLVVLGSLMSATGLVVLRKKKH